MFSYSAYGLHLRSELPLPNFLPGNDAFHVTVRLGRIPGMVEEETDTVLISNRNEGGILLSVKNLGGFLVRGGEEVIIQPALGAEEPLLCQFVSGPVLGILLSQRGVPVFHASSVALPEGAAIFLAPKGHGKSTLAAAFHLRGHPLIADDITALQYQEGGVRVFPGVPQLKLWPKSIQKLPRLPDQFSQISADLEKRFLIMPESFVREPQALRVVYVLGIGQALQILPLSPKEALRRVAPHWYGATFKGKLLRPLGLDRAFQECSTLVQKAPVYLLERPASLERLNDTCQAVEWHVSTCVT